MTSIGTNDVSQGEWVLITAVKPLRLSDRLERCLSSDGDKTLGSLVHKFEDKSFALLPTVLL